MMDNQHIMTDKSMHLTTTIISRNQKLLNLGNPFSLYKKDVFDGWKVSINKSNCGGLIHLALEELKV